MTLFTREVEIDTHEPLLLVALEGWVDAGFGSATAAASVLSALEPTVVGQFDTDALLDHRARRPLVRIVDGVNEGLTWPTLTLRHARDEDGRDVLLLFGPEPDHSWRAFTDTVVGLAREFDVRLAVGLGAFPAPVPHTRPIRLTATATSSDLAARAGFTPGGIEVPAGAQAALEFAFREAGIPAIGLWARVPHYVAAMPFPAASAALLDGLRDITGLRIATSDLHSAAEVSLRRIDELVAQNDEHQRLVAQLESQLDAETVVSPGEIPSGDELAAELERFLREQGDR